MGDNPLIWNINESYSDPGITINSLDNNEYSVTNSNNINIAKTGLYYYNYHISNGVDVLTITRVVYVLDYSVLQNVPVINITEDSSNNILNIARFIESTNYFKNNELALSNDFAINFSNKNETYSIPIRSAKNFIP